MCSHDSRFGAELMSEDPEVENKDTRQKKWANVLPWIFVPMENAKLSLLVDAARRLPSIRGEIAQAFVGNLYRAQTTAAMPYSLTVQAVRRRRFEALFAAGRIRALKLTRPGQQISPDQIKAAADWAHEELKKEEKNETSSRLPQLAESVLSEFEAQLQDTEFAVANQELFYQTLVSVWGALELLANELTIALLNEFPRIAARMLREAPAKRHFGANLIGLDTLEENKFDLSSRMGDVLLGDRGLSSLDAIRDVFSIIYSGAKHTHNALNSTNLWLLWQRRHVVVHRRGVVDRAYLEKTGDDKQLLGKPLQINADDVDLAFEGVIQAGLGLLSTDPIALMAPVGTGAPKLD